MNFTGLLLFVSAYEVTTTVFACQQSHCLINQKDLSEWNTKKHSTELFKNLKEQQIE